MSWSKRGLTCGHANIWHNGRQWICRTCRIEYTRAWRAAKKDRESPIRSAPVYRELATQVWRAQS